MRKNLTFQRVSFFKLELNKKYLIRFLDDDTINYLKGYFVKQVNPQCVCFMNSSIIRDFDTNAWFYDIVIQKEKIQGDMELRAINKILRRLIGDENFKY